MNEYNAAMHISLMTVSEFRAFKKALAVLMRASLTRSAAIDLLIQFKMAEHRCDNMPTAYAR